MTRDRLSALQRQLLEAFFSHASGFYLTGGAALAGFHLGHRTTEDLDFFTDQADLELGVTALRDAVSDPTNRDDEGRALIGGIALDRPEIILANKLCTLISRAELRDLVDVRALERAGYRIEDALPLAMQRDSGLTPAQMAWVLSELTLGDDALIPGGVSVQELRDYLSDLQSRLARMALPE